MPRSRGDIRERTAVGAIASSNVEAVLYFAVLALLTISAALWVIRLAVRYGINDALRMNRDWLSAARERDDLAS